ncbi:MAG: FAD-dependent oxidoreductase [Bacillota bacterium]
MARKFNVVVIGGSAAGITAAITSRRHYPDKSVIVIKKDAPTLIPCGIPYVTATVGDPDKNVIPDALLTQNGIEMTVKEAMKIDPGAHRVFLSDGEEIDYEKLILATGSLPVEPSLPGAEKEGIFSVKKEASYLRRMLEYLDRARHLLVLGGGFIGVEFAEEGRKRRPDLPITVVELQRHCLMTTFDAPICTKVEEALRAMKIEVITGETVTAFFGAKRVEGARLSSGREIEADMVLLGLGTLPNNRLAAEAGLKIGPTGGIQVNRYMQTSDPDIFACGDCAEKVSFFDGTPTALRLASVAATEARIAGANLFGARRVNLGAIGVFSTVLAGVAFAGAGLTEAAAKQAGYQTAVGIAESVNRHPGVMPGAANLGVKLVFERGTGIILGGQVWGAESGGELINVISACISLRMTADGMAAFQMGTHPALTASPIAYQLVNAAEAAIQSQKTGRG